MAYGVLLIFARCFLETVRDFRGGGTYTPTPGVKEGVRPPARKSMLKYALRSLKRGEGLRSLKRGEGLRSLKRGEGLRSRQEGRAVF